MNTGIGYDTYETYLTSLGEFKNIIQGVPFKTVKLVRNLEIFKKLFFIVFEHPVSHNKKRELLQTNTPDKDENKICK